MPRLAAAAQRDGVAAGVDLGAVLVEQPEVAAHDQRPVAVGRDGGAGARRARRRPRAARAAGGSRPPLPRPRARHTRGHPDGVRLSRRVGCSPVVRTGVVAAGAVGTAASAPGSWAPVGRRPSRPRRPPAAASSVTSGVLNARTSGDGERAADQRRDDEQPDVASALPPANSAGPERAGRVHRRAVERDADQVDGGQREADRQAGEARRGRPAGHQQDTATKHEGEQHLEDERPAHADASAPSCWCRARRSRR